MTRRSVPRPRWRSSAGKWRRMTRELRIPAAEPGGADRRQRLGQVHVRANAFPRDRGHLVGLLPRGRRPTTRTTRPRHRRRSSSCTHILGQRSEGRAADRRRCHQRPARRPQAASSLSPSEHDVLPVADRPRCRPKRVCLARNAEPSGPQLRRRCDPPAARSVASRAKSGLNREGFRTVHTLER